MLFIITPPHSCSRWSETSCRVHHCLNHSPRVTGAHSAVCIFLGGKSFAKCILVIANRLRSEQRLLVAIEISCTTFRTGRLRFGERVELATWS